MKLVVFVLGMHRSGTSALTGVLNLMGLDLGNDLMDGTKFNPKGYFENNSIFKMNEKILANTNSEWNDIHFSIDKIKKSDFELYVEEIEKILQDEFKYTNNIAIKDPRMCLLFPIWEVACLNLGYKIKVILPYRNPLEVAQSLKTRDGFSLEDGLLLWTQHILFAEYFTRDYQRMTVIFSELLKNPKKILGQLYDFLDIEKEEGIAEDVGEFLDSNIKHKNISLGNFSKETPGFLRDLIQIIQKRDFENRELFDAIRKEYVYSLNLFQNKELIQKINSYDLLVKKCEELEYKNSLLERIKDDSVFDEEYYIKKYPDLTTFNDEYINHYVLYGNSEGRYPNEYSEMYKIDKKDKLPLAYQLQEISQQKAELEEAYAQKEQEVQRVTSETESILNDMALIKERLSQTEESLEGEQSQNSALKVELETLQTQLQSQTEQLNNKENQLQEISQQKAELEEAYAQKEQEVHNLGESINEIVNDLANIKESKCWIYTKPIRDMQKLIGKNNV